MEAVDRFAKKFKFGKPGFLPALTGDYEHCSQDKSYYPKERTLQETAPDDEDSSKDESESSENKKESSGEAETHFDKDGTATGENGKQSTDGATTDAKVKRDPEIQSPSNQAAFHTENCASFSSFEPHQDYAIRMKSVNQESTQASRPRTCDAANYLQLKPKMCKWNDRTRILVRQAMIWQPAAMRQC